MRLPGVMNEYPYADGIDAETVQLHTSVRNKPGCLPELSIEVTLYLESKPEPLQPFQLDQFNTDFSHYQGIVVIPFRRGNRRYALVSLWKMWYNYCDKSSYGAPILHEFVTDLVKCGRDYRLGL